MKKISIQQFEKTMKNKKRQCIITMIEQISDIDITKNIEYGHHPRQTMDLMVHKNSIIKRPLVILYHGGGFFGNDTSQLYPIAAYLCLKNQYAVALPRYRFAPQHKLPAQLTDAEDAFSFLMENADLWRIDKQKIAVGGSSAGGYLAVHLLGMIKYVIKAGILFNPILNLKDKNVWKAGYEWVCAATDQNKAQNFKQRYNLEDKLALADASILILSGDKDEYLPVEYLKSISHRTTNNGGDMQLKIMRGEHGWHIQPPALYDVIKEVSGFLEDKFVHNRVDNV